MELWEEISSLLAEHEEMAASLGAASGCPDKSCGKCAPCKRDRVVLALQNGPLPPPGLKLVEIMKVNDNTTWINGAERKVNLEANDHIAIFRGESGRNYETVETENRRLKSLLREVKDVIEAYARMSKNKSPEILLRKLEKATGG